MAFVVGAATLTVAWNLNAVVILFSLLFYGLRRWVGLRDLVLDEPIADEA